VSAVLAVGIGVSWLLVGEVDWLFTGGLFAHSLASALLIGLCVLAPHTVVARVLAWQPLQWVGLISYSLYLWHWPVFVLFADELGWVLAVVVSVGLATLSKYLVEDPVRFRAGWARGRTGLLAFATLSVGLAALWLVLPEPAPPVIDITGL
jgi:peptidoglycan/LPS O-acetylase OafA/YrhL